jgi:hypothetical protein
MVLLLIMGIIGVAGPTSAMTPNTSLIFWKRTCGNLSPLLCQERRPGIAVTGTLKAGVFTQEAVFSMGRVSSIAVSRDSLAVYDKRSGVLRTGRFRNGLHTIENRYELRTGYDRMVASCDTVMLVDNDTGHALTGLLVGGKLTDRLRFRVPATRNPADPSPYGWWRMTASCRQGMYDELCEPTGGGSGPTVGQLTDGRWTPQFRNWDAVGRRPVVAVRVGFASWAGWGLDDDRCQVGLGERDLDLMVIRLGPDGHLADLSEAIHTHLAPWDVAAGTADSFLLYQNGGDVWRFRVDGLEVVSVGHDTGYTEGWEIITGGK